MSLVDFEQVTNWLIYWVEQTWKYVDIFIKKHLKCVSFWIYWNNATNLYFPYSRWVSEFTEAVGVLRKRCSKNMQQIYRRTPMLKSNFNKVALQLYRNRTSTWVFSCKFAAYFQNSFFIRVPLEGCFWIQVHCDIRQISLGTCAYQGVRNVNFLENSAYMLNEWSLIECKSLEMISIYSSWHWSPLLGSSTQFVPVAPFFTL